MDPFLIKLIGFAAATCTTVAYAPQAIKVWKTRSTGDISLGMFLVMVLGLALWLVYGLLSGDAPLVAANAVTMVLAGGILFMKLKYGGATLLQLSSLAGRGRRSSPEHIR